jgi:hypothetical protein
MTMHTAPRTVAQRQHRIGIEAIHQHAEQQRAQRAANLEGGGDPRGML